MRLRSLVIPLVALGVFAADQATKYLVSTNLELNQSWYPISFLKPIFAITYIHNTGAVFGILQNQNLFFTIVATVVIIAILYYVRSAARLDILVAVSLGLQLGGACGNLLDRLRYGYVIDFIHLSFWAISNVADASITLGVILLAYHLLFRVHPQVKPDHAATEPVPSATSGERSSESNR